MLISGAGTIGIAVAGSKSQNNALFGGAGIG